MASITLELTRWKLRRPGATPNAVQRTLLVDLLQPQLPALRAHDVSQLQYYVSRQGDIEVWLSVIAASGNLGTEFQSIDAATAADLAEKCTSASDAILEPAADRYRRGLRLASDLSLELLGADDYRAHQRFLVLAVCSGAASPNVLQAYAMAHSPSHRALSPRERCAFWADFYTPGHRPELSYYGHWLWNITVGPQPQPGQDPWSLLAAIGAA